MWSYTLLVYLVPATVAVAAVYVAVCSVRFFLLDPAQHSPNQQPDEPGAPAP